MRTSKKILLYVPTLEGGGAEKVFINLANFFSKKECSVIIITSYGNSYDSLISKKVAVKRLFNEKPSSSNLINMALRALLMPCYLAFTLIKCKPQTFMTAVLEANILGNLTHFLTLSKSGFIIRQAGLLANETHPGKLSFLLKWAFRRAHKIIANSPITKSSIISFKSNVENKIIVIGNPIYIKNDKVYNDIIEPFIMTVGRLESQKDHFTLLSAFSIVLKETDIKLKIFGTGRLEQSLRNEAEALKIAEKVEFLGFKSDLNKYYHQAKLFVLSSHNEAFGNVLIEAMSFGTPVASTNCAGPNFILNKQELGELCEVKNPEALAKAILKVLNHPNNYPKEAIINRAKDFSIEKIGEQYLRVISGNSKNANK